MSQFKPLLASPADLDQIKYPVFGSAKLDGVRSIIRPEGLRSRKLLPFPNLYTMARFAGLSKSFQGLDGELILGNPTDPHVFNATSTAVGTIEGAPDVRFYAFDQLGDDPEEPFQSRLERMAQKLELYHLADTIFRLVPQQLLVSHEDLLAYEQHLVDKGYEGLMIRSIRGRYKFGRSTVSEGILLKVKRFADSEAEILEVLQGHTNTNELKKDELGHAKRSSAKAGKVPVEILGSLKCRDIYTGVEFKCSSGKGHTMAFLKHLWENRDQLPGKIIKYTYQQVGVLNKPRFPQLVGFRMPEDCP